MDDQQPPAPASLDFSNAALVIVAHGSSTTPQAAQATQMHADRIRKRGMFSEVHAVFLKQPPFAHDILDTISSKKVYIVPNMTCDGYIVSDVLPRAMGLTGASTERLTSEGRQTIVLCDPVGPDIKLAQALTDQVTAVMDAGDISAEQCNVLIAGHGSKRSARSRETTCHLAKLLDQQGLGVDISTAFLEEPPLIQDWGHLSDRRNIIVAPFLIAAGMHGAEDIPALLGVQDSPELDGLDNGMPFVGPFRVQERNVWLLRALGLETEIADIIVERAEAHAQRKA